MLLSEINFRSRLEVIQKLGTLQTPTLYLSGTIPQMFIRRIGNYFINNNSNNRYTDFLSEHNTLIDTNILGNKFARIEVTNGFPTRVTI